MPPVRQIAHLDLDCFFVSVERIHDPSLLGKPVVVGGSPTGRGVVASASYEARAYGVHSAMPTAQALRLCPGLVVVHSRHGEYGRISDRLYHRMLEIAPVVERASIDEMYCDFTGCEGLYGHDLPGFMRDLQSLVRKEFSLPCSIALATNKTVAKIAVGTVKPAGVRVVPPGTEAAFLAPLSVDVIPGVGKATGDLLRQKGVQRVGDLQRLSQEECVRLLGKHGGWIASVARGEGNDVVTSEHTRKSISREETFPHDMTRIEDMEEALFPLVEDVCGTVRGYRWKARTVTLKLRYSDFTTLTRGRTMDATDDDTVVFREVRRLLGDCYEKGRPVRLIGVHLSQLDQGDQLQLIPEPGGARRDQMLKAVDAIRGKFGDDVIHVGKP
jgi:DNA polymerase-4